MVIVPFRFHIVRFRVTPTDLDRTIEAMQQSSMAMRQSVVVLER